MAKSAMSQAVLWLCVMVAISQCVSVDARLIRDENGYEVQGYDSQGQPEETQPRFNAANGYPGDSFAGTRDTVEFNPEPEVYAGSSYFDQGASYSSYGAGAFPPPSVYDNYNYNDANNGESTVLAGTEVLNVDGYTSSDPQPVRFETVGSPPYVYNANDGPGPLTTSRKDDPTVHAYNLNLDAPGERTDSEEFSAVLSASSLGAGTPPNTPPAAIDEPVWTEEAEP